MITTRAIHGVVPVVSTPLTKNEEIDTEALEKLVRFLIQKNIGGMWALGTGSEDMNLSFKKRLLVAKTICDTNAGQKPVILGAGFFAMEDILNFMQETKELEFDAYHVMPYHPLLSMDRLDWFYRYIADKSPKPLWMYTSGNWSKPITPGFIEKLKEHPNIAGIKFSNVNAVLSTKVAELADNKFQVITAVASQMFACLSVGSKAHTSSLASALPEMMIEIYELFTSGKFDESLAKQRRLNCFLSEMAKNTKKDNFLQAADEKYILSLRGICEPYVTSYYREINDEEKERIKSLISEYSPY